MDTTHSAGRGIVVCSGRCHAVRKPTPRRRKEPGDTQIIALVNLCPVKGKGHTWNFTEDLSLFLNHAEVTWGRYRDLAPFSFCLWLLSVFFFFLGWLGVFCFVFLTSVPIGICVWSFWSSFLLKTLPGKIEEGLFWYLSNKLDPLSVWLIR